MAEARPRPPFGQIGVAGNTGFWGYPDTAEHVKLLDGAAGRPVWEQMRRSDSQVAAALNAITMPIRQADHYVESASDAPEDVEIARFVQDNLLEGMTLTWDDTVRHALLHLPFGFSILEQVWQQDEATGLASVRKLDPRLPTSIVRWEMDEEAHRLRYVIQRDKRGAEYSLPIEKLLVFTHEREGDNWEGKSILRPAYRDYYVKDNMIRVNAIHLDRFGAGTPKASVPRNVTRGTDDWKEVENALQEFHANEKGYLIEPDGYTFDVMGAEGKGVDVLPTIKYHDQAILKAVLAQFIDLGGAETGSRALGQSFIGFFFTSMQAIADYMLGVINRFCIRRLVDWNWPATGDRRAYPRMRVRRMAGPLYELLGYLMQAGVITPDPELENAVREGLRLPRKQDDSGEVVA